MYYILDIRSDEGELWARRCDDYYYISTLVFEIMRCQKYKDGGWVISICPAQGDPLKTEEIGDIDKIFRER